MECSRCLVDCLVPSDMMQIGREMLCYACYKDVARIGRVLERSFSWNLSTVILYNAHDGEYFVDFCEEWDSWANGQYVPSLDSEKIHASLFDAMMIRDKEITYRDDCANDQDRWEKEAKEAGGYRL